MKDKSISCFIGEMRIYFLEILLFLFAIRFCNKNITFLLIYAFMVMFYIFASKRKITISLEWITLILFGAFYFYFLVKWKGTPSSFMTAFMTYAGGAPLMYFCGLNLIKIVKNKENLYFRICYVIMIGMLMFAVLSYLKNGIIYDYSYGKDIRAVPDFWTNTPWQATNFNGYCILASIIPIITLYYSKNLKEKIISLLLLCTSIYLSLVTAARTNLISTILSCVILYLLLIMDKKYKMVIKKQTIKKIIFIVLISLFTLPILFLYFDNILSYLPLDAFTERLSYRKSLNVNEDVRLTFWAEMLELIPKHPWGNIKGVEIAHNIYLDVARVSGIIPMLFLIIFTIMVCVTCYKLFTNKKFSQKLRIQNTILVSVLLLSFMIEPVMEAKPFIFISFCLICGLQKGLLNSKDSENYESN